MLSPNVGLWICSRRTGFDTFVASLNKIFTITERALQLWLCSEHHQPSHKKYSPPLYLSEANSLTPPVCQHKGIKQKKTNNPTNKQGWDSSCTPTVDLKIIKNKSLSHLSTELKSFCGEMFCQKCQSRGQDHIVINDHCAAESEVHADTFWGDTFHAGDLVHVTNKQKKLVFVTVYFTLLLTS